MVLASRAIDEEKPTEARALVAEAERLLAETADPRIASQVRANLGALMIDLAELQLDNDLLRRGTELTRRALSEIPERDLTPSHFYNAANGHYALWQSGGHVAIREGRMDPSYLLAKEYYRKALDLLRARPGDAEPRLHQQILVNYGNCLSSQGRVAEAVERYEQALRLNPSMPEALGNKAIVLHRYAHLSQGFTHLFLLEAARLFSEALTHPLFSPMARTFKEHLDDVNRQIAAHEAMEPEHISREQPRSPFHRFLRDYCAHHRLYLNLTTFTGQKEHLVHGDPLFIRHMSAPINDNDKFDRYVTFLNQIKHDYVLGRYFLVQSQYRSETVEAIDEGVALYYPLDYSLDSAYIQFLKASIRYALGVLDKIANFVRDYCKVNLKDKDVYFTNLWSMNKSPLLMRQELASKRNVFLWGLFDLALDLRKGGYYLSIVEQRHALTHRFVVVHDMLLSDQTNKDIPRIRLSDFRGQCILATQIARSAVIYLILMVDVQERVEDAGRPSLPIVGTPIDDRLRWRPDSGDVTI